MRGTYVTCGSAAAALLGICAAVSNAGITSLQVRDAAGGMSSYGEPDGYYLGGTASRVVGTIDGSVEEGEIPMGAFGAEARIAGSDDPFAALATFCLEPSAVLAYGLADEDPIGITYDVAGLAGGGVTQLEADQIEVLWANAHGQALAGAVAAAAFQSVIWELAQDDVFDLGAGNFQLADEEGEGASEVADLARAWFDNIAAEVWTSSVDLVALRSGESQDLVVPATAIPTPGSGALLALAGIALLRRRRAAG